MIDQLPSSGALPKQFLLELLVTRDETGQEWRELALCAQTDPEAFFPPMGGSTRDAKSICKKCEVREECLTWALDHDERFGIWGGASFAERKKLKRERGA